MYCYWYFILPPRPFPKYVYILFSISTQLWKEQFFLRLFLIFGFRFYSYYSWQKSAIIQSRRACSLYPTDGKHMRQRPKMLKEKSFESKICYIEFILWSNTYNGGQVIEMFSNKRPEKVNSPSRAFRYFFLQSRGGLTR